MSERKPGDFSALKPDELTPLTEAQILNWRKVLATQYGSYASIMPVAEIEKIRAMIQSRANGENA